MLENIILVFVVLFFCVSFSAMSLMADEVYQEFHEEEGYAKQDTIKTIIVRSVFNVLMFAISYCLYELWGIVWALFIVPAIPMYFFRKYNIALGRKAEERDYQKWLNKNAQL